MYSPPHDYRLRRLGYRVPSQPPSPLLGMLDRAGCRMRPLYRARPLEGHWNGSCPLCGAEDTAYVEPGLSDWLVTCCGMRGTIYDLQAALILQASAA
jgi:hypothetical protein